MSPRRARSTSSGSSSGRSTTTPSYTARFVRVPPHAGTCCTLRNGSDRIDDAVEAFRAATSEIEQLDGFAGGYLLVDHEDGRTMTVTLWQNQAVLESSERAASALRRQAADAVDGEVLSVEKCEVAQEMVARASGV
jgi:heme-degrading monooxygenase HmoA